MRIVTLGLLTALLLPAHAAAADPKRAAGTETIPADGFAFLSVNVAQLYDAEGLAAVRKALQDNKNSMIKDLKKDFGFDLAEIERFTVSMSALSFFDREEGSPILYITARKAIDVAAVMKGLGAKPIDEYRKTQPDFPVEIAGKNVYAVDGKLFVVVDERTVALVEAPGEPKGAIKFLDGLKAAKPAQAGPLADALALAATHTVVAGFDFAPIRKALEGVPDVPAEYGPLAELVKAERALITFDIGAKAAASLKLTFFDADAVAKVEPATKKVVGMGRALLAATLKDKKRDAESKAVLDPLLGFLDAALEKGQTKRDGKVLAMTAGGEVDAALKKSIDAFPDWAAVMSARMQTSNNLKQIGLAMYSYHDANNALPQDIVDKDGKAILSWRVELLPYMEQAKLYRQLDLTKPWDDAANKKFVEQMPKQFGVVGREPKEKGFTYFQSFASEKAQEGGSPLQVKGSKRTLIGITDGTSNTLMVVEGATAVNWLKPGDLPYDPKKLPKVGNDGWFFALFCDSSVRRMRIPKDEVLKALITADGGEVVNPDD